LTKSYDLISFQMIITATHYHAEASSTCIAWCRNASWSN